MKTLLWLQVPTGRCSSLWRILIAPCQARQGVVVLCWHKSLPLFPRLELPRQDVVVLCWRWSLVFCTWRPHFLWMEFEESVLVQLTLNRTQMTWNRVLLPLPMEIDERPGVRGAYEVRLPAVTPVTPPAIGLSHAQWCDKILNESLPGDGFGRGCFDTLPRFVVGDPSARFETHTPLTYETNGETGQPLWKEIFGHILKECAYLTAFQTVYVMVGHSESQSARNISRWIATLAGCSGVVAQPCSTGGTPPRENGAALFSGY